MISPIDLAKLPPLTLVEEIGFEDIQDAVKSDLVELMPGLAESLELDSDPLTKLIQIFAYREQLLRSEYNESARAVTLAFASGGDLDHLAALIPLNRHAGESDDSFRRRIQLAPEGLSVAGPASAYRSHILNADERVQDARVTSPSPGDVLCEVLFYNDVFDLNLSLVEQIDDALSLIDASIDDTVRPLTDRVTFQPAEMIQFDVEAVLEFGNGPDSLTVMAAAESQLRGYLNERRRFSGRISLTGIIAALHVSGVERVVLIKPAQDIAPEARFVPELNNLNLTEFVSE